MKLAVVILNWNGAKILPTYLPSVIKYSKQEGVEVILADNASEDDSLQLMHDSYPEIRCIELDQNYGFAEGYNQALKEVEAEYYMLLNSDVEVTENWLTPLIQFMDKNKDVAACGPKILDYKDKSLFEYAGAAGGYIDKYAYPFCRGRIMNNVEPDNNQYNDNKDVLWVSGCALMIRSELYREHGGLDKGFFAHMEEIDMCWRLSNRGYRITNIPESVVYHLGGATLKVGSPHKVYLNFRNSLLALYKNTDEKTFRKLIKRRRLLDFSAAFKFFLTDGPKHYEAVIRAHEDFAKLMPKYTTVRDENIARGQHFSEHLKYSGSIVFAFYIKQLKSFLNIKGLAN